LRDRTERRTRVESPSRSVTSGRTSIEYLELVVSVATVAHLMTHRVKRGHPLPPEMYARS
jgi:hypothetical protein